MSFNIRQRFQTTTMNTTVKDLNWKNNENTFTEIHFSERPDLIDHVTFVEAILLLNFSCFCIIFTNSRIYKKYHNILLAGLIVSHIGNGIANMLYYVLFQFAVNPRILDISWKSRDTFYAFAISYTMLLSVDRYLAVRKPFYYATLRRPYIVGVNLLALVVVATYKTAVIISRVAFFMLPPLIFLVTLVLTFVNSVLYWEVRKQCKTIIATSVHTSDDQQEKHLKSVRQRQYKTLKICALIAITYTLFWTPCVVVIGIYYVYYKENRWVWNLKRIFESIAILDCIVDAIIYMTMNKDVRQKMSKTAQIVSRSRVSTAENE